MGLPAIAGLRRARWFLKTTAIVVTVSFLGLYLQPLALAARLPSAAASSAKTPPTSEEMLSRALESIEAQLAQLETKLNQRADATAEKARLKTMRQELDALDKQARANFDAIERHLKDKKLPQVILDRHTEAVQTYRSEMTVLKSNLDSLEIAKDDTERKARAQKAREHLKLKNTKKARPKFDPNDMPNKSLQPNRKNTPKLRQSDFVRAGLISNPAVKLAALGDFSFDRLPGASDPAYLAATTEVTLTPAIQAKAQELGHNPVKIYRWVRNNVEWLPTWGATQDADVTLGSQRGNAMDIASLLIALLRASGIPARYVHGTIEMPEDKFRNWAGGFTSINAAADYASSGGIPVTTVVSGGKITKIRLEHIWVEAAIDFHPSRGAINKSADSWIQLDASFKQYQHLSGLDVVSVSGIDPNELVQSFAASGAVNQAEGWVSGFNPSIFRNAQNQIQSALEQHIQNNLPNATVGEVIGGRRIVPQSSSVLSTGLPYYPGAKVRGATYGRLPTSLQNTMTFAFGVDLLGELVNPVTLSWSELNNHKVTLSFRPATSADESTLNSLLPESVSDETQLPSSIPAYLIVVVPELALDGRILVTGPAMRLGEDLAFTYQLIRAGAGPEPAYTYQLPAGSYLNLPVVSGTVAPLKVQELAEKVNQVTNRFTSGNPALLRELGREDILGDIFYAGTLQYFGQYVAQSQALMITQRARHNLLVGFGSYGYEPEVHTFFGFPRAIEHGGIGVNIKIAWTNQALDGDSAKWFQLNIASGMLSSALEHSVPELFNNTIDNSVDGVSAVKALNIASAQGQRIYHLTSANQTQTLPNLRLDGTSMGEIRAALSTGKEVYAHTDVITVPGWRGAGYIILDPVTASGAYKITGGRNGGFQQIIDGLVFSTAAALGYVDGKIGLHADKSYIFSDRLKYLSKLAKTSAALGALALLVSIATIMLDDQLSISQKLGQIAMSLLGFGITVYITSAAVALFVPFFAVFTAVLVAVAMALAVTLINEIYFSSSRLERRMRFA